MLLSHMMIERMELCMCVGTKGIYPSGTGKRTAEVYTHRDMCMAP
jgi:hypothetical protein